MIHNAPVSLIQGLTIALKHGRIPTLPLRHADVAQSVERILGKDEVTSSNLVISSRKPAEMQVFCCNLEVNLQVLKIDGQIAKHVTRIGVFCGELGSL